MKKFFTISIFLFVFHVVMDDFCVVLLAQKIENESGFEKKRTYMELASTSFSRGFEPHAYQFAMAHFALAGEDSSRVLSAIRWSSHLKRPCYGVAFGIGIDLRFEDGVRDLDPIPSLNSNPRQPAPDEIVIDSSPSLYKITGGLGEVLVKEFKERFGKGEFGTLFLDNKDTAIEEYRPTPVLQFIGVANTNEIKDAASKKGVDYVVICDIRIKNKQKDPSSRNEIRMFLKDVANDETLARSKVLMQDRGKLLVDGKPINIEKACDPLFDFIDKRIVLQKMPKLTRDSVAKRIKLLVENQRLPNISKVNEAMLYHSMKLIGKDEMISTLQAILGAADGSLLAKGDEEEKRSALNKILPDINAIESWHKQTIDAHAKEIARKRALAEAEQERKRQEEAERRRQAEEAERERQSRPQERMEERPSSPPKQSRYARAKSILEKLSREALARGDIPRHLDYQQAAAAVTAIELNDRQLLNLYSGKPLSLAKATIEGIPD